ncbi:hypothetical protein TNCV_217801 [Trichonephila clavipes]|nr:hypothetical protein TNCV_217801 [Trichonephila clavipes]
MLGQLRHTIHIPPELLDELQATSSQWDDDGRSSLMDTGGYIGVAQLKSGHRGLRQIECTYRKANKQRHEGQ